MVPVFVCVSVRTATNNGVKRDENLVTVETRPVAVREHKSAWASNGRDRPDAPGAKRRATARVLPAVLRGQSAPRTRYFLRVRPRALLLAGPARGISYSFA